MCWTGLARLEIWQVAGRRAQVFRSKEPFHYFYDWTMCVDLLGLIDFCLTYMVQQKPLTMRLCLCANVPPRQSAFDGSGLRQADFTALSQDHAFGGSA